MEHHPLTRHPLSLPMSNIYASCALFCRIVVRLTVKTHCGCELIKDNISRHNTNDGWNIPIIYQSYVSGSQIIRLYNETRALAEET